MYQMNLNSAIIDIGELIETTSDKKSYRGSQHLLRTMASPIQIHSLPQTCRPVVNRTLGSDVLNKRGIESGVW